jgi:hypothetical protein
MRFARSDMRGYIVSHKNDYGASHWLYGVLQWRSRLKINFCEILGAGRFSTFATWGNSGIEADKGNGISPPGTYEASLMWPCNDGERQWNTMSDWTLKVGAFIVSTDPFFGFIGRDRLVKLPNHRSDYYGRRVRFLGIRSKGRSRLRSMAPRGVGSMYRARSDRWVRPLLAQSSRSSASIREGVLPGLWCVLTNASCA